MTRMQKQVLKKKFADSPCEYLLDASHKCFVFIVHPPGQQGVRPGREEIKTDFFSTEGQSAGGKGQVVMVF